MPHSLAQYLADILAACDHIEEFTANISRETYEGVYLIQSAVERQLIIIGEAIARIREYYPDRTGSIGEIHKIVAFRNVLVHNYTNTDQDDVWSAIKQKLPLLRAQVKELLEQESQ